MQDQREGSQHSGQQQQQHVSVLSVVIVPCLILCKLGVCTFRWAGGRGGCAKLLSASYDGSVRMLDPTTATFELLVTDPDAEYSAMDCLADATSG